MSKRTVRNIIITVVMVLTAIAAFSFMVYQVTRQGALLTEQISTLEKQQSQETSYLQLQRLAEETMSDRTRLNKHFLSKEDDSIDLLNKIEDLAPSFDLVLKTNDISVLQGEDQSKWIEILFTFSGSYQNTQTFIKVLESLPYVIRLNSVNLKALSASEWSADVTMQVQVLSYET